MSNRNLFSTRSEAIYRLIIKPIEATGEAKAEEFCVNAIAAEVLDANGRGEWGYADTYNPLRYDEDGMADTGASDAATEAFWDVVRDNAHE